MLERPGFRRQVLKRTSDPVIRQWFAEAEFEEMAFETAGEKLWGVGAHRFGGTPRPFQRGVKLFTFLDHAPGLPA